MRQRRVFPLKAIFHHVEPILPYRNHLELVDLVGGFRCINSDSWHVWLL